MEERDAPLDLTIARQGRTYYSDILGPLLADMYAPPQSLFTDPKVLFAAADSSSIGIPAATSELIKRNARMEERRTRC